MKKLICFIAICLLAFNIRGQDINRIDSTLLFDISESVNNPILHYWDAEALSAQGVYEVVINFDSLDCDGSDLYFDAGNAFRYEDPVSYKTAYGELIFPLQLDTAAERLQPFKDQYLFTRYTLVDSIRKEPFHFKLHFDYDRGWIVYTLHNEDPATCTKGYIWKVH